MLDNNDTKVIEQIVEKKTKPQFDSINKTLKAIQRDIKTIMQFIKFYDKDHQRTKTRVDRIDDILKLPPINEL